ncbi:MAG: phosphate/phosphite/phosphonate ABC transporter substrate-binding protein [Nitrospiraceae bacterium]|nr:MAG: phosphate/phosphite/phosphonate ABC transporter substrate-binding protein [Nitrospiraceae bacterium]
MFAEKLKYLFCLALIFLLPFFMTGCTGNENPKKVNIEKRSPINEKENHSDKVLRVAIGAMITPEEGFAYYKGIFNYMEDKLDMHIKLIDRRTYSETNDLIKTGNVDIAFVCTGAYVSVHDEAGAELIAMPQINGRAAYHSYIIVHKDSGIKNFTELKGRSFAFTDPLSNTGKTFPTYLLIQMNETPDTFFSKYIFTNRHDKSIAAVAQGFVDGAAVDGLIWDYLDKTNPQYTSQTKIILKSRPFASPPIIARKNLSPELKENISKILIGMHDNNKGREILKGMMIDRFVRGDDADFESARNMITSVRENQKLH